MNVTATIDKRPTGDTLADLDEGVAARVRLDADGMEFIRWRDGNFTLGPAEEFSGRIITSHCEKPGKYKVIEVLGKFSVTFEPD